MYKVDLNCDLGESFGAYRMGMDEEILPFVTSANVACGFHASDPLVMAETVGLAKKLGTSVGAHPGFPDLLGFGRRNIALSKDEAKAYTLYQLGALSAFCKCQGLSLQHIKLHGAFYNMAAQDPALAEAVCSAVREFDPELVILTLSGSLMLQTAKAVGLAAASEIFADRAYDDSGALVPRTHPGSMITDENAAVTRVVKMIKTGRVTSIQGNEVTVTAHSICVHGDGPKALAFVKKIRARLEEEKIQLCPLKELSL